MSQSYRVIGLMSGTSLDGVDIACCSFELKKNGWEYRIEQAETVAYSKEWKLQLVSMMDSTAVDYLKSHVAFGKYYGELIQSFIQRNKITPVLIASHGHTVFHQPQNGFTAQIGDGSQIAAITGIDTICDFRSKDLALGGQGAPLVPGGEVMLFSRYRFCLNLGGIANITILNGTQTVAFDICPVNMALNYLTNKIGMDYDKDGLLAAKGKVSEPLLKELNNLSFYKKTFPKSLGREWFEQEMQPLLDHSGFSMEDKLATVCEHVALQIAGIINQFSTVTSDVLFITGGGAFNPVLISKLSQHSAVKIEVPDKITIAYKEALIFAFLGLLYHRNEMNVLCSVTGANRNHIGGALYKGS